MNENDTVAEKNPIQIKSGIAIEDDKDYIMQSSGAQMSLKIDVERLTEEIERKVQKDKSNTKEIQVQPEFQVYIADRNLYIKLENIRSFDPGVGEMHMKQELDDVKLENEGFIVKNEASLYHSSEEIHMKKELDDVKLKNERLIIQIKSENGIDMTKTDFEGQTSDSFEQPKDPSQIKMFHCNWCDYQTKYKSHLTQHMLVHKEPSDVQMFECSECDYRSNRKTNLKYHMLVHRDPSEVEMFKCNECDFQCKRRFSLKQHMLVHGDLSRFKLFKCNECDYQSKRKGHLTQHMLVHKDPSQIEMFKCKECDYQCKRKQTIEQHMRVHKDPSNRKLPPKFSIILEKRLV